MGNSTSSQLHEVSVGRHTIKISGHESLLNESVPIYEKDFDYTPSNDYYTAIINPSHSMQEQYGTDETIRYTLGLEQESDLIVVFKFTKPKSRKVQVFVTSASSRDPNKGSEWDSRIFEISRTEETWSFNISLAFPDMIKSSASMKFHLSVC
jgi:hypothetical protein